MARIVLLPGSARALESMWDLFARQKGDCTDHFDVLEHALEHIERRVPTESQEHVDGFRCNEVIEELFAEVGVEGFGEIDGHVVFWGVRDGRVVDRSGKDGGIDGSSGFVAHDKMPHRFPFNVQVDLVEGERPVETVEMCENVDI